MYKTCSTALDLQKFNIGFIALRGKVSPVLLIWRESFSTFRSQIMPQSQTIQISHNIIIGKDTGVWLHLLRREAGKNWAGGRTYTVSLMEPRVLEQRCPGQGLEGFQILSLGWEPQLFGFQTQRLVCFRNSKVSSDLFFNPTVKPNKILIMKMTNVHRIPSLARTYVQTIAAKRGEISVLYWGNIGFISKPQSQPHARSRWHYKLVSMSFSGFFLCFHFI